MWQYRYRQSSSGLCTRMFYIGEKIALMFGDGLMHCTRRRFQRCTRVLMFGDALVSKIRCK